MLSDNELHFFLYADFAKEVVDIREQFPLFPQEETAKLAEDLGISHPRSGPWSSSDDLMLYALYSRLPSGWRIVSRKSVVTRAHQHSP
jgi:proteasome lid subunit RPN8/RPN11